MLVTLSEVVNGTTAVVDLVVSASTDYLTMFCQPPLVIFIGITVAAIAFGMIKRAMRR